MTVFFYLVTAGFGLIFGSFFNVCIYRLPISKPLGKRSECPECGAMIKWYDNVPVVSFIVLRRRCRSCGLPISWRYPLVELTTAGLFVLVYWWSRAIMPAEMGLSGPRPVIPELFIGLVLVSVLIIATVVDLYYFIIPNEVIYPGIIVMFLLVTGIAIYRGQPGRITIALLSGLLTGGVILGLGLLYGVLVLKGKPVDIETTRLWGPVEDAAGEETREEESSTEDRREESREEEEPATGVGMGDGKLLLFTGLALGFFHWYLAFIQVFVGALLGALVGLAIMAFVGFRKARKIPLPFGPFLAVGAVFALIWGQQLVDWFLKLSR